MWSTSASVLVLDESVEFEDRICIGRDGSSCQRVSVAEKAFDDRVNQYPVRMILIPSTKSMFRSIP